MGILSRRTRTSINNAGVSIVRKITNIDKLDINKYYILIVKNSGKALCYKREYDGCFGRYRWLQHDLNLKYNFCGSDSEILISFIKDSRLVSGAYEIEPKELKTVSNVLNFMGELVS